MTPLPGTTSFAAWVAEYEASLDAEGLVELESAREAIRRKRDGDDPDEARVPA